MIAVWFRAKRALLIYSRIQTRLVGLKLQITKIPIKYLRVIDKQKLFSKARKYYFVSALTDFNSTKSTSDLKEVLKQFNLSSLCCK